MLATLSPQERGEGTEFAARAEVNRPPNGAANSRRNEHAANSGRNEHKGRASVGWVMMGWQIKPASCQRALAQHDELGDHAGQSEPEDHENEFCQYGSVVVRHEILRRLDVSSRGRTAGSRDRHKFCPCQGGTGRLAHQLSIGARCSASKTTYDETSSERAET
jgi:hypothetical protein